MKYNTLLFLAALMLLSTQPGLAQTKKATKAAYHRTASQRAKPRAGAYSRYDASKRRGEEHLQLAPGMRLNMPSPPTTDYMGRPLKKKPAKPVSGASSLSSKAATPSATKRPATTPRKAPRKR
ncbi:hypothetical protein [Hymenobacter sp. BT730]|uniref:hypothetical protein n=1 Tax=Hymenobacter sp. BT730 TaxID=3063332 RepID=UPI0026E0D026|nr:hypothetical protein [Hymenobacter sp. BT730]